ncbi:OprO/OprP family phosphate-selective porin [Caulobacter sp. CCH9-E1]|uniref:OprO/OprP family phosphate-selective porin n=1 Tax=Caulobacter sp. CCH9-E1 TaxID=1768768 RepID=UPI00082CAA2D|nr:porin [Caulobacter sp. CCH9-E1]
MIKPTQIVFRAALIAGVSLLAAAGAASAQTTPPSPDEAAARIAALEAQLAALQQQVADLKAATAASFKDVRTTQAGATVSIAGGKPTIVSGDGAYSATLHGVMQLDTAHYFQDKDLPAVIGNGRDLNNGTNFRRARLGVDGKFAKNFDYSILLDFGGAGTDGSGVLQEIYLQYNYAPFKVRVGAFAPNLGLEDAASTNGSLFPERPSAAEAARGLAGADRRIALQAQTVGERWILSGAVTGAKAGDGQTFDEQLGYLARLAGTPLKGQDWLIHVGANASVIATPAQTAALSGAYPINIQDRPELRVDGQQLIGTGAINAKGARHYGLELAAQKANFLIQGEVFDYKIDRRNPAAGVSDPRFKGWYVEGGWVLTGEARKYNTANFAFDAPTIANPFDPKKGKWGAWELAARYSVLDLNHHEDAILAADRVRGGEQTIWTAGLNWFPNSVTKFSLDYLDVDIDRKDPAGGLLPLSQSYQAINLRSQFAF